MPHLPMAGAVLQSLEPLAVVSVTWHRDQANKGWGVGYIEEERKFGQQ